MKVSIITVTYNSAKTLIDTIRSVQQQTYEDIEYIIVDGGSTDGTLDIVRQWEEAFAGRMRWLSEPDKGIYDAMNKGIRMAVGDVVGILNSDDFLSSDTVIAQMASHFDDSVGAVYGDVHFVKEKNLQRSVRYYSGRIFRPQLIRFGFFPPHPSLYIRRELFERYGYYNSDYRISADFEIMARLSVRHKVPMKYIHLDFVTMRMGGESTRSLRNRIEGTREDLRACRENGIKTNSVLIYMKYIIKVWEALFIRK